MTTDKIPTELWKRIHRIEIKTRRLVNTILSGQYMSVFKGSGLEFQEVRPYQEGDDERYIDWNVTARTGDLYVKQFIEERELNILFLVDISPSLYFGSQSQLKLEQMIELFSSVAFSALRNNDQVGLLTFDEEVCSFYAPKKGRRHILRLIRELLMVYNQPPTNRKTNIESALKYVNRILRRKSVIFILSDFLDKDFYFPLKVLAQRHDCIAVISRDIRDSTLPPIGLVELVEPETGETLLIDLKNKKLREKFQNQTIHFYSNLEQRLRRMGMDLIVLDTSKSILKPLISFFNRRKHRK